MGHHYKKKKQLIYRQRINNTLLWRAGAEGGSDKIRLNGIDFFVYIRNNWPRRKIIYEKGHLNSCFLNYAHEIDTLLRRTRGKLHSGP